MRDTLARLEHTIAQRSNAAPDSSYVASLFAKGRGKIAQKVGEEATETIIAALSGDADHLTAEAADLLFHLMVLLNEGGVAFDDVLAELAATLGASHVSTAMAERLLHSRDIFSPDDAPLVAAVLRATWLDAEGHPEAAARVWTRLAARARPSRQSSPKRGAASKAITTASR